MPNQHVSPSEISGIPGTPTPCTITPALLKQHSITPDEYTRLEEALGRTPSLTELGIFSVMWSEHCSYKSSRVHLRRLPTKGTRLSGPGSVVQGPGENAGIIDVGDGWACAFKIESHNHPSYIEPYQGAATGVGGILRDIFTMGARPLAVMDSLRFGPLSPAEPPLHLCCHPARSGGSLHPQSHNSRPHRLRKNHQVANGVVHGVAGYGNCFGVPNLGGETRFEPCYSGNPLLNAFALGLVRTDEIFYAAATGVGNPVFYVGAKTGRDGIHGATMASEEFTEGSEQKRPNVQMGDPFLEKLLLEACLEVMKTGAVLGIQDMGAAGLTCSTCEMGAKGELGVSIELDLVPQRETGMTAYEIMLSESQERMLLVAEKGREQEVLDVFDKWGLDCAEVGIVTADDVMRVRHHGELVAEIPNKALTDNAPVYHRPVGAWTAPVPKDPPQWVLDELKSRATTPPTSSSCSPAPTSATNATSTSSTTPWSRPTPSRAPASKPASSASRAPAPPRPSTHRPRRHTHLPLRCHPSPQAEDSLLPRSSPKPPPPNSPTPTTSTPSPPNTASPASSSTSSPAPPPRARPPSPPATKTPPTPSSPPTPRTPPPTRQNPNAASPWPSPATAAGATSTLNSEPCTPSPKPPARSPAPAPPPSPPPTASTSAIPKNPRSWPSSPPPSTASPKPATALGTPITGGNVSLYNETRGEGIYPTPVIGVVGLLDDVTKAVPNSFQRPGDDVLLISLNFEGMSGKTVGDMRCFGSSEYANTICQQLWGMRPGHRD